MPLFKESRTQLPVMPEGFKLSTERRDDICFGCLIDPKGRVAASAFGSKQKTVEAHLAKYSENPEARPDKVRHRLTREMIRLYNGESVSAPVQYNMDGLSSFQRSVYKVLEQIPKGKVTTYGLISKHLESAPRAVGRAVASNPLPLFIPCERVVNFDLTIGNYGLCGSLGPAGTVTKRGLLERENVLMTQDRIDRRSLWNPSG